MNISKKYEPLWTSNANYFILTGGRGSGKSFAVADFLENLTFEIGHTILFTRYTLTSAHISIIPEFVEKIEIEGHESHFKVNVQDIENTSTSSKILFRGIRTSSGNQTASLKSIQNTTTWVLDEAEELVDENIFDKIDESVRQVGIQNRIIIILNPTTKEHWIYQRFFEGMGVQPGFNGQVDNVCYIHTTYLDNIVNLSEKFIYKVNKLKADNPRQYEHRIMGGWLDKAEGAVFTDWEYGTFDSSLPYGYGLDFGFSVDPDALIKVAIDEKKKIIYWKECIYQNGLSTNDLISRINRDTVRNDLIIADNAEQRLISDIRTSGANIKACRKGSGSVIEGLKLMLGYKHVIDNESINIGREFNNYAWHDKKSQTPVDDFNHAIDAGRYYISDKLKKRLKSKTYGTVSV